MAPARAFWKGYLKLSLVSCPIALYTGTSATERVSFRQINKKTGNRLRQQLVDEVTREPVEAEAKGRGYEYAKNAYIPVDDDELDALAVESKHTIEIDSFVPREQIDERYLDSPYYITPDGQVGQDAFAVIAKSSAFSCATGYRRTAYFSAIIFSTCVTAISSAGSTRQLRTTGSRSIRTTATAINLRERVMPQGG
jgi:non-homologous end joining protein Ku